MRKATFLALFHVAVTSACAPPAPPHIVVVPAKTETPEENLRSAEILFDEGVALYEQKKFVEAIPKFEVSDRLDHKQMTRFLLAECYENVGRVASAWTKYTQVANEAEQSGRSATTALARDRAEKLKDRLPQLKIFLTDEVAHTDGIQLSRNGEPLDRNLWNVPDAVDPGEYMIVVSAPHKIDRKETVKLAERDIKSLEIRELKPWPMSRQRVVGFAIGAVGVTGVVLGSVFGGLASWQWAQALKACEVENASDCDTRLYPKANEQYTTAMRWANGSTTAFIVGGAALATGAAVFLTGPISDQKKQNAGFRLTIAPVTSSNGAAVLLDGNF